MHFILYSFVPERSTPLTMPQSSCIMYVHYIGDVQYIGGFSTLGDTMSTLGGYHEYIEGVQYIRGYHEHIRGDVMSTSGEYHDACGGIP